MINYILDGHEFNNEVQTGIQIFYPVSKYNRADKISDDGITILSGLSDKAFCKVYEDGKLICEKSVERKNAGDLKSDKYDVKKAIYVTLMEVKGYKPPWGMLTGIRPAKITGEFYKNGLSKEEAIEAFGEKYFVERSKAGLAVNVYDAEMRVADLNKIGGYSIYVGIPFCASRCLYCSFTSYSANKYSDKIDKYIDSLIKEFEYMGARLKGKVPDTVYIGGGTPTAVSADQLDRIIESLRENFLVDLASEFTVEAGRPDTITAEKLEVLKKHGVSRISINPQTMNDKTLEVIGRRHSVADIKESFALARQKGFNNINMDIILGLPGEGEEEVRHTLSEIEKLSPDSLTVHTLAVKRASELKGALEKYPLADGSTVNKMLEMSADTAKRLGMIPYYMYRQKNMLGSFENVGYSLEGKECIYNIKIMEETQTIIALGAGGVTKTVCSKTGLINRVFNVKSVDDYINRIDEMLERKEKGLDLEVIL